jgi:hypothetical protein
MADWANSRLEGQIDTAVTTIFAKAVGRRQTHLESRRLVPAFLS